MRTTDPTNVYQERDVTTISNIFLIDGGYDGLYEVKDVPHGSVSKRWYHSDATGTDRRMTVYTPAGYETSGRNYPVLYLLHGMGGDENAWSERPRHAYSRQPDCLGKSPTHDCGDAQREHGYACRARRIALRHDGAHTRSPLHHGWNI